MTLFSQTSPFISAIVPSYNEGQGLAIAIKVIAETLDTCESDWEIIVVDDGSNDDTFQQVDLLSTYDSRIKGVSLSRNFGKEAAIIAGLKQATGQAVIIIDADLQHPPALIPDMIEQWRLGAQIIHCVKSNRKSDSLRKRGSAYFINHLISSLGGININNSSDFKLLDREIVDILVHQLPERERFFRGLTSWLGFSEHYLYFDVASRQGDKSKWSFIKLFELAITALTSFTSFPLRIITILGFSTLLLSFFVIADAFISLANNNAVSGFVTLIICLLVIGSFIMISLGIIGEYIAKIYEEVKNRPHYLIKASIGLGAKKSV